MDNKEERQLISEIQNQIQRARRATVRNTAVVSQQRDVLERLIGLVQSPYSSLKSIAANNIKFFIKDFPELEDDAINAVYDLCEDQDPRVRKDGYRAITYVSREQKKWVKRNADVLVQLLQSDEPEEVEVVEQQLTEHLDLDPVATLGVLCDQIAPPEEPMDEEDQAIRDRLRSLVLGFMKGRAKRGIVERHASQHGSQAEVVLVNGLLKAISKLPPSDIDIIVKDILLSLPSYGPASSRGDELLEAILVEAKASYKIELPSDGQRSDFRQTRLYLNLAAYIVLEKPSASPANLLRFYCPSLVSRIVLQKWTEDFQVFVISNIAGALQKSTPKNLATTGEDTSLFIQTIDVCAPLFSCLVDLKRQRRPWQACKTLLQACIRRKDELKWSVPTLLSSILQKLQTQASEEKGVHEDDKSLVQEVQNLIRSLLQPVSSPKLLPVPASASTNNVAKGMANSFKPNGIIQIKRKREDRPDRPITLPPRPPITAQAPQTQADTPGSAVFRMDRQRSAQQASMNSPRSRNHTAPMPTSSSRGTPTAEPEPLSKRKKGAGNVNNEGVPVPSLLSRLTAQPPPADIQVRSAFPSTSSIPAKRRAESESTTLKRADTKSIGVVDIAPPGGYSIKGAARANGEVSTPPREQASSLLDRMNRDGHDGDLGGRARKRRIKT